MIEEVVELLPSNELVKMSDEVVTTDDAELLRLPVLLRLCELVFFEVGHLKVKTTF